jgi:hypothetical protein
MHTIEQKYMLLQGTPNFPGAPIGPEGPAAGGGLKREYANGTIYWKAGVGAFEVHGAIRSRWLQLGAESFLGYPVTDETAAATQGWRFNNFEHGAIYWSGATGADEVYGDIRRRWVDLGGETSVLGYPMTGETATPNGTGRYNHFQGGSLYWTPATGANEVVGVVRERWAEMDWEKGPLGFPVNKPLVVVRPSDGRSISIHEFQGGFIEFDPGTGDARVRKKPSPASPNYVVTIQIFRVSDDDGSNTCQVQPADVAAYIKEANLIYAAAGISFVCDGSITDVRNTRLNKVNGVEYEHWEEVRALCDGLTQNKVSVFFRSGATNGFSWTDYDFIAMPQYSQHYKEHGEFGGWLFAHEMGHFLGLAHTQAHGFDTLRQASDRSLSGLILDSSVSDVMIEEIKYEPGIRAILLNGRAVPLARDNVMSYWARAKPGQQGITARLTLAQIERVRSVLLERRNRYLTVQQVSSGLSCADLNRARARKRSQIDQLSQPPASDARRIALEIARYELEELNYQWRRQRCAVS